MEIVGLTLLNFLKLKCFTDFDITDMSFIVTISKKLLSTH
jgi:hypothetical protein